MTLSLWRLGASILFVLASALAVWEFAPASLVGLLIERASANRLTLVGASGRLRDGRGTLTARSDGARVSIAWTVDAKDLAAARLAGTLRVGAARATRFAATFDSLEFGRIDIALPAALVAEAIGAYGGYKIGGTAALRSEHVLLQRDSAYTRLTLEWTNAASGLVDVAPLGSYVANIEVFAGIGTISVHTKEGPLLLDGTGRWSQARTALALNARASGERAELLKAWLRAMTPEQPDGVFRFVWPARAAHQRGPNS
jgi:hypothetical protein